MKTEPYRSRSLAPGLVISLLIHAGLLALFLHQRPAPPAARPSRWLTVSLVPTPAPRTVPVQEPVQPPPGRPAESRHKAPAVAKAPARPQPPRHPDQEAPRNSTAITMIPATPADPPDPFAAAPARPPGAFDANAALQSARKLAVAKAGKDDPAVAQLRDKPAGGLAGENELAKGIKQATRPDCLTSSAGAGILAPLLIAAQVLTDKKDHGCKW